MNKQDLSFSSVLKFIIFSAIGLASFTVPITYNGSETTIISALVSIVGKVLAPVMNYLVIAIVSVSAVCSLIDYVLVKKDIAVNPRFHAFFKTSLVYIIVKFLTLGFVIMCTFNIGPQKFLDSAASMVSFGSTLTYLFGNRVKLYPCFSYRQRTYGVYR